MSDELALTDTNVLVYAYYEDSVHHTAAFGVLDQAQDGQIELCIASQVLAEFYAIVTNPRRVTAPYRPDEALGIVEEILTVPGIVLLPTPVDIVDRWLSLLRRYPVTRGAIFDLQLVATMLGNDVSRIYTFDRSHFERFDGIEVLAP